MRRGRAAPPIVRDEPGGFVQFADEDHSTRAATGRETLQLFCGSLGNIVLETDALIMVQQRMMLLHRVL